MIASILLGDPTFYGSKIWRSDKLLKDKIGVSDCKESCNCYRKPVYFQWGDIISAICSRKWKKLSEIESFRKLLCFKIVHWNRLARTLVSLESEFAFLLFNVFLRLLAYSYIFVRPASMVLLKTSSNNKVMPSCVVESWTFKKEFACKAISEQSTWRSITKP